MSFFSKIYVSFEHVRVTGCFNIPLLHIGYIFFSIIHVSASQTHHVFSFYLAKYDTFSSIGFHVMVIGNKNI